MENNNENEIEINLLDLFYYLKKKWLIIMASILACAAVSFLITQFLIVPQYTASSRIYVLNRSNDKNVVYSDVQISGELLKDYKVLITGQNVTHEVINTLGLDMSASELASKISVTAPEQTRILQISVTDTDPQRAADIANSVWQVAAEQLKGVMDVDGVNLVYEADVPTSPSSPNLIKNIILAALVGFVISVGIFVVIFVLDDEIHTEEDVTRYLQLNTLGVIPDSAELRSFSYQTDGKKKKRKKNKNKDNK